MTISQPLECAGVTLQGERRGFPCGAPPKYLAKGKTYCAAHYVVALKQPKRFREAVEYLVRFEAKQIMKQREAERVAKVQTDWVPNSMTGAPMVEVTEGNGLPPRAEPEHAVVVLFEDPNFSAHGMHSDTP